MSPITAALCGSLPLAKYYPVVLSYKWPPSINFLALSQAPPALAYEVAIETADTKAPGNKPATAYGPMNKPITNGVKITKQPGAIISFNEC